MSRGHFRFRKFGDWALASRTLRWYAQEAGSHVENTLEDGLDWAKDELVSQIESQSLGLAPHSASWSDYKGRHGLDPRVLIATGDYLESFDVSRSGSDRWQLTPKGQEELAGWLEYGTADMPARPHWVYASDQLPGHLRNELQKLFRTKGGAR